ncbi:MAG: tetratricopeptide repeat protein [Dehalococcoidia bacterium]|nr:tetratricopeptide repeat protein [Dehalococcoidia bacterium]
MLTAVACTQSQETFETSDEYVAEGLSAYERGELDRALHMYDRALQLDPDNAWTLAGRSVIHLQKPETYDDAIVDATRAIELDPSLARAYVNRATALVDMGHSEYARVAVMSKITSRPGTAWTLPPEERVERAIADATRAVELDPNMPDAYFVRAHAQMDVGRSDMAVDDFSHVLDSDPTLYVKVMAYVHRSQAHRNIGNLAWAIDDATKAMELAQELSDNFGDEPRLVTWHGFDADAIEATAFTNRGLAYDRQGRPDISVNEYTQALDQDSDYIEAYVNRSNAFRSTGQYEKALADANKAIESGQHLAVAYNARALANLGLGNEGQALSDATEAIRQDGTYALAYSNRAYIYTGQGRYDLAISDATKAIDLDPDLAEAYSNRAEAHLKRGDYPGVIADSTSALSRDPSLTGAYLGRALAYLNEQEYSKARSDAEQVLQQAPGQLYAVYVRGAASMELTGGMDGREDLERVISASRSPTLVNLARRALSRSNQ